MYKRQVTETRVRRRSAVTGGRLRGSVRPRVRQQGSTVKVERDVRGKGKRKGRGFLPPPMFVQE